MPDSQSPLLKLYQVKIPVTRADIAKGALDDLVRILVAYPKFREMEISTLLDNLSFGFGYQDYADLLNNVPDAFDSGTFPSHESQFAELIAWRMYTGHRCGLSDALVPISVAWDATPFEAKNAFTWDGWLENGAENDLLEWGHIYPVDWRLHLHEVKHLFIQRNELLFCAIRYEMSHLVAEQYYDPACGISVRTLANDLEKEALIPLEDALQIHGPILNPPGLTFKSYYDIDDKLVGHGFSCQAIRGYLKEVFPDKESLFNATVALWRCEPIEQWAATALPETIFVGEFQNPWWPPRAKSRKYPEQHLERAQLGEEILQSLLTCGAKIHVGHDVVLAGATYTREPAQETVNGIDGLLGLKLEDASEVPEDYCAWLLESIPFALDPAIYECLGRTSYTLNKLKNKELEWINDTNAQRGVHQLARLTSKHAMPMFAYGADVQRRWEGNWLAHAIEYADAAIRKTYPMLDQVKKPCLGEYALDYFGKDALREGVSAGSNIEFLQYAILRNLGLDPFYYFPETEKDWLGIFRLVRLHLLQISHGDFKTKVQKVASEARTLLLTCGKLLRLFEELDTSSDISRISVHKHYLARKNA